MSPDRHALRAAFDEDAARYDRARPGYPDAVLDAIDGAAARAGAGRRVLEIGCGTGQATVPLARRGYEVVAVELGPSLAGRARVRLAGFPNAQVVTADVSDGTALLPGSTWSSAQRRSTGSTPPRASTWSPACYVRAGSSP